jgi:L-ascorbate metabolism protein UlaG (beta-lactamase superfamily)
VNRLDMGETFGVLDEINSKAARALLWGGGGGGNAESYSLDLFLCAVIVFEGGRTYAYGDSINHDAERGWTGIDAALLLSYSARVCMDATKCRLGQSTFYIGTRLAKWLFLVDQL